MKNIGIWLDSDKAYILSIVNGKETFKKIPSNIEHFHVYGGSGSRFKGGPQDVIQDRKYLERKNRQFKRYFKTITSNIEEANKIAIFGPAEAFKMFKRELEKNYSEIESKVLIVERSDSMTNNQIKSLIRDYFKGH